MINRWLTATLLFLGLVLNSTSVRADVNGFCGRPYDTAVTASYPIKGTWMYNRSACSWQDTLEAFHRVGGTSVLQFGPGLVRHADPASAAPECRTPEGISCMQDAINDIGQSRIRNWLSYTFGEHYSSAIACPSGLDKKIEVTVNGTPKVFWRVVLPHDGQTQCDYTSGGFDVLFTSYDKNATESVGAMLTVADHLGMAAYLGAPALPVVPARPWEIDTTLLASHRDWARRVYADWNARHAGHTSFRGMYQSFEMPLGSTYTTAYEEYATDAASFHAQLPGRDYVLSPYLFQLKDGTTNTKSVAATVDSFRLLATSGVDVIAPQDGRGTGKGAYYWPYQTYDTVGSIDPMLGKYLHVDENRSFNDQFVASARDAFQALQLAQAQLKNAGTNVRLWANIEAFEEDRESADFVGCNGSTLSQTTKPRMDRAITFIGGRVDQMISFMYDPLFTCTNRFSQSLLQSIQADHDRPIITDTFFWDSPSTGLAIHGHGLSSGISLVLTWYDANWNLKSQTFTPGWSAPGSAGGLDAVWIPFPRNNLAPSFYIHVGVARTTPSGGKTANSVYSMKY